VDKPSARSQPTTTKQEDSQTTTDQTDTADAGNRRDSDHKKRIRQLMEQAIAYYRKATDKYSKFRRAWKNLGTVHMRLANYGAGTKALKRVIELDGETGRVYGLLGYAYSKQSKPLSAEGAYRKAIMLDSNTLDWKRGLARSFFEQERFAEAVALLGQLLKQEPERANLWRLQGKAYLGMKKPMEAAKNFEMVDKLGDASYATLTTLGDIYVNNKLYDPAVAAYTRAMKLQPDGDADRIIRAARVLASQGAYRATAKLTKQIKSVYGQSLQKTQRTAVLKVEARVAVAKGHDDKRAAILERVVKLKPMDGEALMLLGKHYSDRGAIEKAISYYERAGNLDQHEADAKVRKAQLRVRQEKYDAAIRLLRRAQELEYRENVQRYLDQIQRLAKRG
jgi:tetratricopeptide (TPR) repeat protein